MSSQNQLNGSNQSENNLNSTALNSSEQHGRLVSTMFAKIVKNYDFCNHTLSLGIDYYWRKCLLDSMCFNNPRTFLDLASGTMDVALALKKRKPKSKVIALDFCLPMLERGLSKAKEQKQTITAICADAKNLPLVAESIDCASIAFGIRNILPRIEAFRAVLRILRPKGRFCILEFASSKQAIMFGLYNFYLHKILPSLGRLFSGDTTAYSYLAESIAKFPLANELKEELLEAGFAKVSYQKLTFGIVCLHIAEKA